MAPNHDPRSSISPTKDARRKISEPSLHQEPTSTNAQFNSNNPPASQQRAYDGTFVIVQYVLFSLLGRKVDQVPSAEAKKVCELTKEILAKHDVYNQLCSNVGFTPENLEENFVAVAENIFEDGVINWGRIIALLGFSVKVAEYFRIEGFGSQFDQFIVELTTHFIVNKTSTWVQLKGGWVSILFHDKITDYIRLPEKSNENISLIHDKIFVKITFTEQ